jgi:peptide subunit release factor 1 (eRF1)
MTDLELRRSLADLCELRSDAEPIVTLYLDTSWTDEKQRERSRLYVQEAVRQAVDHHSAHPQLNALRRTLGRIAHLAAERHGQTTDGAGRGLAVFACESLGLFRVLESPRPFRCELCVDGRPHLVQLARLLDDVEPAIVAFVHERGAQIYEVALGAIVSEATIEGADPRGLGQGGRIRGGASASPNGASGGASYEREQKNQRHVDEVIHRVRREAAELLRQLWERDPRAHIVFVGTSEKVAAFERDLPERMREKVLARLPRPPSTGAWTGGGGVSEVLASVVEKIAEHERAAETKQVEHAIGEAMRGGLAVLGPEDVVLAVNERRVHRLILEEDFQRSGWRCRNCGALGMNHDEVCSFCQGALARVDALGEELVGRVLAEDGEVEVVAHTNRLHSYRGVAALLRQAKPKGLSGRQTEAPRS